MLLSDWIGALGVTILLLAYFLQIAGKIDRDSYAYILLNIVGAGIACAASLLISYMPFVVLEGCWTIVSVGALLKVMRKPG